MGKVILFLHFFKNLHKTQDSLFPKNKGSPSEKKKHVKEKKKQRKRETVIERHRERQTLSLTVRCLCREI